MSEKRISDKSNGTSVPVFTQLCAQVNFSLFGNTLTIYPKLNGVPLDERDYRAYEATQKLNQAWSSLGQKVCILRNYPTHGLLHQDQLTKEHWHTHVEFVEHIDENKLTQILNQFVLVTFITEQEKNRFIKTFREANKLPQTEFDKLMANKYLKQLRKSIQNNAQFRQNNKLMSQMNVVLQHFEALILTEKDLTEVQRYIKETQLVIDNPTRDNIANLEKMSTLAARNPSPLWQAFSVSLILLGIFLCTAGLMIATALCGTSMVPGIGITLSGLGLFSAGVCTTPLGTRKGSKDLTHLTELMNASFDESVAGGFVTNPY